MGKTVNLKMGIYSSFLLLMTALQIPCQGQYKVNEKRNLTPFDAIDVSEGIGAYLEKGDKPSVLLEITEGKPSDVLTDISGGTLKISLRKSNVNRIFKDMKVKAYVTYVELNSIEGSSGANIVLSGVLKVPSLDLETSSAASIEASIDTNETSVEATSAGNIILMGKTNTVRVQASSAGEVDAYKLKTDIATIKASSVARVNITVEKKLEARASSGAIIRYWGDPAKTEVESSSGGSIKRQH